MNMFLGLIDPVSIFVGSCGWGIATLIAVLENGRYSSQDGETDSSSSESSEDSLEESSD